MPPDAIRTPLFATALLSGGLCAAGEEFYADLDPRTAGPCKLKRLLSEP